MRLTFTDDEADYARLGEPHKLLIRQGIVERYTVGTAESWARFNAGSIHLVNDAWADTVADIERWATALRDIPLRTNRYLATRDPLGRAHSLVQLAYLEQGLERHLWRRSLLRVLGELGEANHLEIRLRPMARLLSADLPSLPVSATLHLRGDRSVGQRRLGRAVRQLLMRLRPKRLTLAKVGQDSRLRILFFVGLSRQLFELFESFFALPEVRQRVHVDVVLYGAHHGLSETHDTIARVLRGVSHRVLRLEEWERGPEVSHSDLYRKLRRIELATRRLDELDLIAPYEQMYAALGAAVEQLRPHLVLHNNIYDPSRVLSDVARFYGVPSLNVQYSLFPDIPSNKYSIRFDARAHINAWTRDLFQRIGDPTPRHEVIGYLKFDSLKVSVDRAAFEAAHGLRVGQPTVFFGSTYNFAFDYEKVVFAEWLTAICARHGWNLLIKKHPVEVDTRVAEAVTRIGYSHARVFAHSELPLVEALALSDVVTNQSSGLALEALYLDKPLVYLSLDTSRPEYYKAIDEPFIPLVGSERELEAALVHALSPEGRAELAPKYSAIRERYLHVTDGRAGERLWALIKELAG